MEDGFYDFWELKDYFLNYRHSGFRIKGKCEECGTKLSDVEKSKNKGKES